MQRGTKRAHEDDSPNASDNSSKKLKYKSEYTEVTVKKNPLLIQHSGKPPESYRLVLYGNAQVTEWLLDQSRKKKAKVWLATDLSTFRSRKSVNGSGFNVSREGYYFRGDLVEKACHWFQVKVDNKGRVSKASGARVPLSKDDLRDRLIEIYPRIPDIDRDRVLDRLDPKTGTKIGKSKDHTPYQRIELAVISHVRHRYTDYDKLLSQGYSRNDARKEITEDLTNVLSKWKGEGMTENEYETEIREIITLDDDDEDELEDVNAEDEEEYEPQPADALHYEDDEDDQDYEPPAAQSDLVTQTRCHLPPPPPPLRHTPPGHHVALRPIIPNDTAYIGTTGPVPVIDLTDSSPPRTRLSGRYEDLHLRAPPPQYAGHHVALRRLPDEQALPRDRTSSRPNIRLVPLASDVIPTIEHSSPPTHREYLPGSLPLKDHSHPGPLGSPTFRPHPADYHTSTTQHLPGRYPEPANDYVPVARAHNAYRTPPPAPDRWAGYGRA